MESKAPGIDQPIVQASSDEILSFILSTPPSDRRVAQIEDTNSNYNAQINMVWHSRKLDGTTLPRFPEFVESTEPRDFTTGQGFRKAIYTELRGRSLQHDYYKALKDMVETTDSPDQFDKLIDVYGFLLEHTKGKGILAPTSFARLLIHRAVEYVADDEAGDANPMEAAQAVLPAMRHLLDQQYRLNQGDDERTINVKFSSQLLGRGIHGTAEHTASLRLREVLSELGYEGFGQTDSAKSFKHKVAERYVTSSTLESIEASEGNEFRGLPQGPGALEVIQDRVIAAIKELSASSSIAENISQAIQRLRSRRDPFTQQLINPLNTLLTLANALTPDLNKREGLTGDLALQKLDEHDHTELKYAFQRILFAINPSLLSEAVEGPAKGGSKLRLRMTYVEALCQQWVDYRRVQGPTVGDFVLRMKAHGYTNEEIAKRLSNMMNGRPDTRATANMNAIIRDPNTKKNRVVYSRFRPGYGVFS